MYKTISNEIIRKFNLGYDPSEVIKDENEELPIKDWVQKYRDLVPAKDIFWLLLRREFLSEKDLRLFAVWCAREALKFVENPDERIVEACNVAERYVNGEATKDELDVAYIAADYVADVAYDAIRAAYYADASNYASNYAANYVAHYAALSAVNAARAAVANSDLAALNAAIAVANAASVVYFASFAASDTVSRADADAAAEATRAAQIDQLLTYFE
jgi:hypothetical protein